MTDYRFPETKLNKGLFALFLTAVLYLARDTLVTSSILGFYKAQFLMAGLFFLAVLVFLWHHRRSLRQIVLNRRIGAALVCAAAMLLPMAVKRDWQMMYFSILICLFFAIFLTYFISYREVAKYYVVILAVIGAYSVAATYLLRRLLDLGLLEVPVFENQAGIPFYNFYLSYVSVWFVKTRNFGIFREPGVYQFFLVLGLYLNHYAVTWDKNWKLWLVSGILVLTLVTTFATGGIVELILFCVLVFFEKGYYRNKRMRTAAVVLVLAVAAAIAAICLGEHQYLYWTLHDMVLGKFIYQEENLGDRVGSVLVNLQFFFRNPLFGGKISDILYAIANNTTSTLIVFAIFGLGGGILHVAGWLALVWDKERKLWANLGLLLVLFMSFNTQNLTADMFFWLFPMMAMMERTVLRERKKYEKKRSAPMTPGELRKVQLVELEIAKDVKRVCEENGIRYFLYRGTFLGAVRHKGVIPWDDDMDFGMLREDYDRFRAIAPEALGGDYCFQDWSTDESYALPFGKVRKRGTAFVEAKCARQKENGIYIDIYPLDFAPSGEKERKALAFKLLHLFRLKLMKCGYTPWMEEDKILWKKRIGYLAYQLASLFFSQKALVRIYENLVYQVPAGDTLYEQSALPIAYYFDRSWCENLRQYPYEDTTFPGPEDYDSFLSSLYGDYMTLPPEGKRENRHQIQELSFGEE